MKTGHIVSLAYWIGVAALVTAWTSRGDWRDGAVVFGIACITFAWMLPLFRGFDK